jgi:hypothetical protein
MMQKYETDAAVIAGNRMQTDVHCFIGNYICHYKAIELEDFFLYSADMASQWK